uniref:Neurensin 1-like n=1 Tax=Mastacembelus armatus TaxID=205130 RepID=A0A7N9B0B2_9TELE
MALCSEACVSVSGGESSSSEFGVRSYLHHFYEECSSSVWDRDSKDHGFIQSQRSVLWWNSAVWKRETCSLWTTKPSISTQGCISALQPALGSPAWVWLWWSWGLLFGSSPRPT